MKKTSKRIFCKIIANVVVLTLSFTTVFATETTGNTPDADMLPGAEVQVKLPKINLKADNVKKSGKPKLIWKKAKNVKCYSIFRSRKKDGFYAKIGETKKGCYIDKKANGGITYYYKIRLIPSEKAKWEKGFSRIVRRTCDLPRPKITKISNVSDSGKIKIFWKKVKGASRYKVYRSLSPKGKYKYLGTTKKTSLIHQSAKAGTHYYYKVKAVTKKNYRATSAYSFWRSRVCDLRKPVLSVELSSKGKPKLSWKKQKKANRYIIYRAVKKNGSYKRIGVTRKNTYVDKSAKYRRTYYYRIKAANSKKAEAASAKSKWRSIYTINLRKKMVALTFDDGPGPYTKRIVNCLRDNDAQATFFVQGQRVKSYKSVVKAAYRNGNEIGSHSYNHADLSGLSGSGIRSQMIRTDRAIKRAIGEKADIMRPPYGAVDDTVRRKVGKPMILWSIDTLDWQHRNAATTVSVVLNQVEDGDIVLMHDIHEPTMRAALELIPRLKKRGYELVTVSDLAKYKGVRLKDGRSYFNF